MPAERDRLAEPSRKEGVALAVTTRCVQVPGRHADCLREVALQRDTGRQGAVEDADLGDLGVRVEKDGKKMPLTAVSTELQRKCAAWWVSPLRTSM